MTEEKPAPTEEQIKASNEAEEARWNGDFDQEALNIPYKRAEDKNDDASNDEETEEDANDEELATKFEYSEPASSITMQDPGVYTPANYSFEVTLKDGKTIKVNTPEEADKLADDPDNFETPRQLSDFLKKSVSMQNKLERDYEKWEEKHKKFAEQSQTEEERRETIESYVGEFNYLVGKGLLPAVDKKYLDADWSDPEVAKQPGVKEQLDLLNYMTKENALRAKAKVKPLNSIVDTYNAWMQDGDHKAADEKRRKEEADKKASDNARKVASSRVSGISSPQQGAYVPKGIAVGNPNVLKRSAAIWDN